MAEDANMSKVKVSRECLIVPQPDTTVLYPKGFEGTVPNAHIDILVNAKAGERVGGQQKVAENEDAFKSGSDNANV
jgi:hypothetical protein